MATLLHVIAWIAFVGGIFWAVTSIGMAVDRSVSAEPGEALGCGAVGLGVALLSGWWLGALPGLLWLLAWAAFLGCGAAALLSLVIAIRLPFGMLGDAWKGQRVEWDYLVVAWVILAASAAVSLLAGWWVEGFATLAGLPSSVYAFVCAHWIPIAAVLGSVAGIILLSLALKGLRALHRSASRAREEGRRLQARRALERLPKQKEYDLVALVENGVIGILRATGVSITQIRCDLENRTGQYLSVAMEPGTLFVAGGQHQSMVATRRKTFLILGEKTVEVAVACANAGLPIPGESDDFIRVVRRGELERLLRHMKDADPMSTQAAVWAVTDGYTAAQVKGRLVQRIGTSTFAAVRDEHVEEARKALDELGFRHNL